MEEAVNIKRQYQASGVWILYYKRPFTDAEIGNILSDINTILDAKLKGIIPNLPYGTNKEDILTRLKLLDQVNPPSYNKLISSLENLSSIRFCLSAAGGSGYPSVRASAIRPTNPRSFSQSISGQ